MENSCLKKYKPSSKKWILASRCAGLRRNSALVPANAGLFHYAGNNPVRYIDPDGRDDLPFESMSDMYDYLSEVATSPSSKKDFAFMANITSSLKAPSLKNQIIGKLNTIPYASTYSSAEKKPVDVRNRNFIPKFYSFKIGSNSFINFSASLSDMSSASIEDVECSVNKMGAKGNAVIYLMQVSSKITRGMGDVKLSYVMINGKVVQWCIDRKTSDSVRVYWERLSENDAKKYLDNMKEGEFHEKNFRKLNSRLD